MQPKYGVKVKLMVEHIEHNEKLLAIVIRSDFQKDGIEFFTPDDFSQQMAYMHRPTGYKITPHVHNVVERKVEYTQEVLLIKRGKVRVDFFDDNKDYIVHCVLLAGDVILLAFGGHGFTMLEDTEMIEVKQGPFAGDKDKIKFEPKTEGK